MILYKILYLVNICQQRETFQYLVFCQNNICHKLPRLLICHLNMYPVVPEWKEIEKYFAMICALTATKDIRAPPCPPWDLPFVNLQ